MSAVDLLGVKIGWVHVRALEMKMQKLVLGWSLAQMLPEKTYKSLSSNNPGFIVHSVIFDVFKTQNK